MNRRSLFRLLAGAAAAVCLPVTAVRRRIWSGVVHFPSVKQVVAPFTGFDKFTPGDGIVIFPRPGAAWGARNLTFDVYHVPMETTRERVLDNLDASRDARLTSHYREAS